MVVLLGSWLMGAVNIERSLLWYMAKLRLPSKHLLKIWHWSPCPHRTAFLGVNKWHVYVMFIAPVIQKPAYINQVHRKSLFERGVELSGWRGSQNPSSITFQREPPFSYSAETSLIITVFHWLRCPHFHQCDGEEAGCRSVAQLISTFLPSYVLCVGHW